VSIIRPFKGLRPKNELVEEFSCPPYDVLEDEEVKEIVSKYPKSFLRVIRAEVDFNKEVDPHSEEVYKKAKENLDNFKKEGILIEEKEPALYIYRETWKGHSQTGIFATFSVDEYQKAKKEIIDENDPVKQLDVYILQNYVLDPILGIENPRKDPRIHFLGGIRGVKALEDWIEGKDWKVAFSMYPTSIEELMAVADANKTMPPKSTWFEPKLRSGLLIHEI